MFYQRMPDDIMLVEQYKTNALDRLQPLHHALQVRISTAELRRMDIHFYESAGAHKTAKPAGQHGAETAWALFEHPQEVHISDLIHSSFDTHTPQTLEFADEDREKMLYFALRWENTRDEKGHWSDIQSAIVP